MSWQPSITSKIKIKNKDDTQNRLWERALAFAAGQITQSKMAMKFCETLGMPSRV